jgi:DGQHR domain-containing protein
MSRSAEKYLILRALRSKQANEIDVFSFFVPGELIVQIADISRLHHDEVQNLHGFQRKEIKNHVNSIVEYLDQIRVLFPNAIILAFSKDVEFKQSRGRDPEGLTNIAEIGTISIPLRTEGQRVAWIVDGQQRSLALAKTKNKNIPVPVVAFVAPDLETQRAQFILVNKAKPLPTRLINELLPEVDTHLPRDLAIRKIPSELCNMLNRDPNSPFYQLIRRSSQDEGEKGVVVDTALIEIIKKSVNNPLGSLSQYKGFGEEPSDLNGMYRAFVIFWNEVRAVFKDAWGLPPTKSRLMHSAGIKAMGTLMDRVMSRAQASSDPAMEIRTSIEKIAPHCRWTSGTWDGIGLKWDEIQNVNSHVRVLADYLVKLDYNAKMVTL